MTKFKLKNIETFASAHKLSDKAKSELIEAVNSDIQANTKEISRAHRAAAREQESKNSAAIMEMANNARIIGK